MIRALVQLTSRKYNASLVAFLFFMVMLISTICFPAQSQAVEDLDKDEVLSYASDLLTGMVMTDGYEELFDVEVVGNNYSLGSQICAFQRTDEGLRDLNESQWPVYDEGVLVAILYTATDDAGETTFRLATEGIEKLGAVESGQSAIVVVEPGSGSCTYESASDAVAECGQTGLLRSLQVATMPSEERTGIVLKDPSYFSQPSCLKVSSDGKDSVALSEDQKHASGAVRRASGLSPQLPVPIVYQGENQPLCWAGSVSSIGWYLTTSYKSPTEISTSVKGSVVKGGDDDAVAGLRLFKYPSSTTAVSSKILKRGLTDDEIKTWIGSGVPVYAHLFVGDRRHAVVVCGWYSFGGSIAVYVMNPGPGAYQIMTKNSSGIFKLYYNSADFLWSYSTILPSRWQKPYGGTKWSYLYDTGARATKWLKDGSYWYYFDSSGYMYASSWVKDGGSWYYVNSAGVMQTGWTKVGGYWYYMNSSGVMQKGWVKLDGSWYYLRPAANTPASGPEGAMLANGTWTINGKAYKFNSSGVCLNP